MTHLRGVIEQVALCQARGKDLCAAQWQGTASELTLGCTQLYNVQPATLVHKPFSAGACLPLPLTPVLNGSTQGFAAEVCISPYCRPHEPQLRVRQDADRGAIRPLHGRAGAAAAGGQKHEVTLEKQAWMGCNG